MARLGQTVAGLSRYRRDWADLLDRTEREVNRPGRDRLREVGSFGSNPGNLRMLTYVPEAVAESPALVVVLHGCTQTAAGYDYGTGWSSVADQHGFVLLFPEQRRANNANSCFNWFEPGDTRRGSGEALSIRQMVERMIDDHRVDRSRIFVTGLSAGGAMTSAMLATYPEVFAGGAIIAGLPYGAATNVREAFEAMHNVRSRPAREWGDLVRAASPHKGAWPKISVWHGTSDTTVAPTNATEIVKQWADVHGVSAAPALRSQGRGFRREAWRDAAGHEVVESFTIANMAHGTPLSTGGDGQERCGAAGAFLLDVGVSSTHHIARFWGLMDGEPRPQVSPRLSTAGSVRRYDESEAERDRPDPGRPEPDRKVLPIDVRAVITKALTAAGLLKS